MSSVTVPALAVAVFLSNLSWPLGSAESLTVLPAPPPAEAVDGVLVVAGAAGVLGDVLLLFLLPPQPATASAATRTRAMWNRFGFIGPLSRVLSGRPPRCN